MLNETSYACAVLYFDYQHISQFVACSSSKVEESSLKSCQHTRSGKGARVVVVHPPSPTTTPHHPFCVTGRVYSVNIFTEDIGDK